MNVPIATRLSDRSKLVPTAPVVNATNAESASGITPPEPKLNGYPEEVKQQAIRLYLEGANFRRIGRLLGVNYQSAVNWVNAYHQSLPVDEPSVASPEVVELDEVFTFIGSKKRKPTSSRR